MEYQENMQPFVNRVTNWMRIHAEESESMTQLAENAIWEFEIPSDPACPEEWVYEVAYETMQELGLLEN